MWKIAYVHTLALTINRKIIPEHNPNALIKKNIDNIEDIDDFKGNSWINVGVMADYIWVL